VLVERGEKITGVVDKSERAGRMQDRHPDLQQQSDRGKRPAETPARELEMASLPIG
jgi:hypothetical protein